MQSAGNNFEPRRVYLGLPVFSVHIHHGTIFSYMLSIRFANVFGRHARTYNEFVCVRVCVLPLLFRLPLCRLCVSR